MNQYSFWYTGQVVTQSNMQDFTNDLYTRFTEITQAAAPCILYLNGVVTESGGVVTIPEGAYRFANLQFTAPGTTDLDTAIFGIGESRTVNILSTDTGYIVAQYTLNGAPTNPINLTVDVSYSFVTTFDDTKQCAIAVVTNGAISAPGNYYINSAASNTQVQDAIDNPVGAVNNVALTPFNLSTILNNQSGWFRNTFIPPTNNYQVIGINNYQVISYSTNQTLDFDLTVPNRYGVGFTIAVLDSDTNSLTMNFRDSAGNNSAIIGAQDAGYYLITTDSNTWKVLYMQGTNNYSPVVTQATLPTLLTGYQTDSITIGIDQLTVPIPITAFNSSNNSSISGGVINLSANTKYTDSD